MAKLHIGYENPRQFLDRLDAGKELARMLSKLSLQDPIVCAVPRGGVPVADVVARELKAPLDIVLVRKVGVPDFPELAIGAVAEGGFREINTDVVESIHIAKDALEQCFRDTERELQQRIKHFRAIAPRKSLTNKTAILIDDGIATGATLLAAVDFVRSQSPKRIVLAVPVAAQDAIDRFLNLCDEIVCVEIPESFHAVGQWYQDFRATSDEEIDAILQTHSGEMK